MYTQFHIVYENVHTFNDSFLYFTQIVYSHEYNTIVHSESIKMFNIN